jgi:hypothetical protein
MLRLGEHSWRHLALCCKRAATASYFRKRQRTRSGLGFEALLDAIGAQRIEIFMGIIDALIRARNVATLASICINLNTQPA